MLVRAIRFWTEETCHLPPRAGRTPRALRASAIPDSGFSRERDELERLDQTAFGVMYSSLGYLRSFPFDRIKIDQSFIRDLPAKEDSLAIVRAVVGLSGSLGIKTTAEGVETAEQLASLTSEGCNEFQGFLFSEPRPAAEIARMFDKLDSRAKAVA